MAHLPIRRKAEPWNPLTLVPVAVVLAVGISTTLLLDNGQKAPVELAREAGPVTESGWQALQMAYLGTRSFTVGERTWVLAEHPTITHFDPIEIVSQGTVQGWPLVANRARGVAALGAEAKAFDRLYLDLGDNRFAPLRWRDVPR